MERSEVGAARRSRAAADDADKQSQDYPEGLHERSQASIAIPRRDPIDVVLYLIGKRAGRALSVSAYERMRCCWMLLALSKPSVCRIPTAITSDGWLPLSSICHAPCDPPVKWLAHLIRMMPVPSTTHVTSACTPRVTPNRVSGCVCLEIATCVSQLVCPSLPLTRVRNASLGCVFLVPCNNNQDREAHGQHPHARSGGAFLLLGAGHQSFQLRAGDTHRRTFYRRWYGAYAFLQRRQGRRATKTCCSRGTRLTCTHLS